MNVKEAIEDNHGANGEQGIRVRSAISGREGDGAERRAQDKLCFCFPLVECECSVRWFTSAADGLDARHSQNLPALMFTQTADFIDTREDV